MPEDVERFDEQWRATMAAATESLDLAGVQRFLEAWRRIARLTVGLGHDGYRRKRIRPQAVAAPGWSRSLPSARAR